MTARFGPDRLLGIAAPLALWAAHFLLVYVLQGLACAEHWQRAPLGGLERVTWWLLLATAVAMTGILWLGLRALRLRRETGGSGDTAVRRRHFTATVAAASALLALIAVVFTATPVVLLPPCA